jgi:hypothetical protein
MNRALLLTHGWVAEAAGELFALQPLTRINRELAD